MCHMRVDVLLAVGFDRLLAEGEGRDKDAVFSL